MPNNNKNFKTADTSVRVLETLKLLSMKPCNIEEIKKYYDLSTNCDTVYTNEAVLKYLNTLKVFGFDIVKENNRYKLLNPPCPIDFNKEDLSAIATLNSYAEFIYESKLKMNLLTFLHQLERKFSKKSLEKIAEIKKIHFENNFNIDKAMIGQIEKFCDENLKIEVKYKNDGLIEKVIVEPIKIIFLENNFYLNSYNPASTRVQNILISNIEKIEQLPTKNREKLLPETTIFKLKSKLAQNYKLYEHERLINMEEGGSIIIANNSEDKDMLMRRIFRYGENCEVISSKKFRLKIAETLDKMISLYE